MSEPDPLARVYEAIRDREPISVVLNPIEKYLRRTEKANAEATPTSKPLGERSRRQIHLPTDPIPEPTAAEEYTWLHVVRHLRPTMETEVAKQAKFAEQNKANLALLLAGNADQIAVSDTIVVPIILQAAEKGAPSPKPKSAGVWDKAALVATPPLSEAWNKAIAIAGVLTLPMTAKERTELEDRFLDPALEDFGAKVVATDGLAKELMNPEPKRRQAEPAGLGD